MDTSNPRDRSGFGLAVLSAALLVLSLSELYRIYSGAETGSAVSRLAFLALCPALIPYFSAREWALTALAGALTAGLLLRSDGWNDVLFSLDRAAFFGAFIYLVTLLKEAAQRSSSVLDLGVYLTRQPTGRRFYGLAIGGHAMGVLLNFGAISLLTPLIQRGATATADASGGGAALARTLEQQQISALLRGFSWMIMWSPTALTQAVLYTAFTDARAAVVIPLGIGSTIVMILIGRLMDRIHWRDFNPPDTMDRPEFPIRSARRFALICLVLILTSLGVMRMAGVSAAIALMLVAPIVMIVWIFVQTQIANQGATIRATLTSLHEIFVRSAKDPARSAYILGAAGFIGEAAAKLAPVAEVAAQLNINALPVWVFLMTLPILITLGGQIALSPILVVVFLSAVINELPVLPADPSLIVFALGAGWALSMTASPNASATLLISAITKIAPTTLTWRWNGAYALVCFMTFTAAFIVLTL